MTAILEKHPQIRRVAVAFEFQMLPEVPTEPTDISSGDHCYRKISLSSYNNRADALEEVMPMNETAGLQTWK